MTSELFTFDLVSQPWIPCERLDGTRVEYGIRETLARAHELAAVSDESPLVTAVLHRLLLAILDRALKPKDRDDWLMLWEADVLPMDRIDAYLEQWRHRFDLFHPERPFMQVARLEALLTEERGEPPARLLARTLAVEHSQYGSDVHLFEPTPQEPGLTPPEAARSLLSFQGYAAGGKIKNETTSWTEAVLRSGVAVLARATVFGRTLLLNTIPRVSRPMDDLPPWERDRPIIRTIRSVIGPIDQLTWPSRRVHLLPEPSKRGVMIREVITAAGERSDTKSEDPQFCYLLGDKESAPFAVKFRTGKATWRDSAALFEGTRSTYVHRRPWALDQLANLASEGLIPRRGRFDCELLGLSGKPANTMVYFWRHERWPLPPSILMEAARVSVLRGALSLAEDVGLRLERKVLFTLCERAVSVGDRAAHSKDVTNVRDSLAAMPHYWSTLGRDFEAWLPSLGDSTDPDDVLPAWKTSIRATAEDAFALAARKLGTSARAFQAIAVSQRALRRMLREAIGTIALPAGSTLEAPKESLPA